MNRFFSVLERSLSGMFLKEFPKSGLIGKTKFFRYPLHRHIRLCSKSALEIILLSCINLFNYCSSFCPAFHRDIARFDAIYDRWKRYLQRFQERCMADFSRGVTEEDFLPGQNYELISIMLAGQLECPKKNRQTTIMLTLIRGVCTNKGSAKLDKLLQREKEK